MKIIYLLFCLLLTCPHLNAQTEPVNNDVVESPGDTTSEDDAEVKSTEQALESAQAKKDNKSSKNLSVKGFQTLGELTAFSDLSVIQKRFLPKTNRLQTYLGLSSVTNNPFFNTSGFTFKMDYNFLEEWGVGFSYFGMNNGKTKVTDELLLVNVKTESLLYTKAYSGLNITYAPIYGKMALFNKRIIPFDLFFGLGYGKTTVEYEVDGGGAVSDSVNSLSLSTGQVFAINKTFAFRWDFTWNFYDYTMPVVNGNQPEASKYNNLFINIGMSAFFPGAKYR